MAYTRPFPVPERSARTEPSPASITASGQVSPSPSESIGSSWVMLVTVTVVPLACPENRSRASLWFGGHSSSTLAVIPLQPSAFPAATVMPQAALADAPLPSTT